ncbi:MAG: arsenate reductase ArsC [Myxococcales bacterium]|jgi:arsenate reductase|nr:MAG: arsenate reductase ArsC [Myxococcales bacterium]
MADPIYNVLFVGSTNSVRSIIAECILNHAGAGRFVAYSAGCAPKGEVHPYVLDLLLRYEYPTSGLRSKNWQEMSSPEAKPLHFVFTLCERAAAEKCPVWQGQPVVAHWGLPDPAAAEESEAETRRAFDGTLRILTKRIGLFINLPLASLDERTLQQCVNDIGRHTEAD